MILARPRVRQLHVPEAFAQVALVQLPGRVQMRVIRKGPAEK